MRCVTWSRDSHGLFDYGSKYINKKDFKTTTQGKLIRVENDVLFTTDKDATELLGETAKPLLQINKQNGQFYIQNDTFTLQNINDMDLNNRMFLVVRSLKNNQ